MGRLAETFPEARILATVREQRALLQSYYGHYIRGGGTASLADFLAQPEAEAAHVWDPIVDLDFFDYAALLKMLQNRFGAAQVSVVPMEWMLSDPEAFLAHLSETWGLDLPTSLAPSAGKVVNPAWAPQAFEAARLANHLQSGKPRWRRYRLKPNRWAARVDRVVPSGRRAAAKARQASLIEAALVDRYDASNAALAQAIGIDLAAFGYRTA